LEDWRYREQFELEDRHWWFRVRRRVISSLLTRASLPPSPRILDAGCGTGRNLLEFGKLGQATGVDVSPQAVEFCRGRGVENVRQAAVEQLPFEASTFDVLLATDVIEHVDDDMTVLRELRRVAAREARLILTVPAYQWLWSAHDESVHHRRRYTARRLRERVLAAGWAPTVETYFFSTVLPPVVLVRTARRRTGWNGKSDLALPPPALNRLLELSVRGEARLIERGLRLPAGVSVGMVCVAR
jgi:SAM-dependent methyltransferase